MTTDIPKILQGLDIGLSRALRYSFPGILLLSTAAIVEPCSVTSAREILGWQLLTIVTLVIGTGLYAIHRSLIIPVHHLLGISLLRIGECLFGTNNQSSLSPTRWLSSMDIPWFRRMLTYTDLRSDFFTEEEKKSFDIQHAENGLVVMISEAMIIAPIYSWIKDKSSCLILTILTLGIVLFFLSAISAMQLHRVECAHFKADSVGAEKIIKKFKKEPPDKISCLNWLKRFISCLKASEVKK